MNVYTFTRHCQYIAQASKDYNCAESLTSGLHVQVVRRLHGQFHFNMVAGTQFSTTTQGELQHALTGSGVSRMRDDVP